MRIVRMNEIVNKMEFDDEQLLIGSLLQCAAAGAGAYQRTKGKQVFAKEENHSNFREEKKRILEEEREEKLVCVTSGASFLGLAVVNCLLSRGYSIRIAVENDVDSERLREMMEEDGRREGVNCLTIVTAKVTGDVERLCQAFRGCVGVFHTSAFADPAGVSGYSKYMADLEVKACENVMEACRRTESVKKCVFTSSLLACVWRDNLLHHLPSVVNHDCWSNESVCRDKKLWFALGKTMAEKAAWKMAEGAVKLATICPGLLTGPQVLFKTPASSIPYLKGAKELYVQGLLATTDVNRAAEAHVRVYEAMKSTASGRYICFDHVISSEEEVVELENQMGLPVHTMSGNTTNDFLARFKLCNRKLSRLMSWRSKCY